VLVNCTVGLLHNNNFLKHQLLLTSTLTLTCLSTNEDLMISQWRHRRRRRISSSEHGDSQASDDEHNDRSHLLHENENPQLWCGYRTKIIHRRQRVRIGVITLVAVSIAIYLGRNNKLTDRFRRLERYINNSVRDKYVRGMLFQPLRYLRVKWMDPLPTHEAKFVMSYNSTFVINLESDRERWTYFQKVNQKRMEDIQRIPATLIHTELLARKKSKKQTEITIKDDDEELKTQQIYFDQYPVLEYLARNEGMGTAACSLSHLRLFQEFLEQDDFDYMYVFEDDIDILDPLLGDQFVMAPNNADVVMLSDCSFGFVQVSWLKKSRMLRKATSSSKDVNQINPLLTKSAIRVISGFSAWGYIITKRGARIILEQYKNERTEPIDLYFFKNPNLKVYLPTSKNPVVAHGRLGAKSARRNNDN
jgi:GR25 family glycosyltransferase involved in LPS biosynthesis